MRTISQLLLNFLLDACWQQALIAAVASGCSWLLRHAVARQRHMVWVAALIMSLSLPWWAGSRFLNSAESSSGPGQTAFSQQRLPASPPIVTNRSIEPVSAALQQNLSSPFLRINEKLATVLVLLFLFLLLYRGVKLGRAWQRTRAIRNSAHAVDLNEQVQAIIDRCRTAIGVTRFEVRSSNQVSVPLTVGIRDPLVILPEQLLREADTDVLTSAIGHEVVHVLRRDYLLNVVYELIYLPLSFHPAAALVRRRINQTRELSCDELVTEKLLTAEVYAHSLVQLAGSAVPFGRKATLTVGITDADILEVRIMSLLKRSKLDGRRTRLLTIAASVLLATPCVATAAFGLSFDIAGQEPAATQESQKTQRARAIYRTEPEYTEDARANKIEGIVGLTASIGPNGAVQTVLVTKPLYPSLDRSAVEAMKQWRFEPLVRDGEPASQKIGVEMVFNLNSWQQDVRKREKLEQEELKRGDRESEEALKRAEQERSQVSEQQEREMKERAERDPQFRAELEARERHQQDERKAALIANATLARAAKITMEQAIQIANSQYPGKVMECSLVAQHWESLGKLARDSRVLYHVVIISPDDANPTLTHVLVNALDGTIYKTEREERRPESSRAPISGGVLNSKAISMPNPEYPRIARAAQASGTVTVRITIDEGGNVIEAQAMSGHPLLQSSSVAAARQAKFAPTFLTGEAVRVSGLLTYTFVAQ